MLRTIPGSCTRAEAAASDLRPCLHWCVGKASGMKEEHLSGVNSFCVYESMT